VCEDGATNPIGCAFVGTIKIQRVKMYGATVKKKKKSIELININ